MNTINKSKYIAVIFTALLLSVNVVSAKSADEKIAEAMNSSDWFALDSLYRTEPKDSISDFLEVYSRCLLGNRLNRTDVSIPAFGELFNTQSSNLDLGLLLASAHLFSMDLSRTGDNEKAAKVLTSVLDATRDYLVQFDSTAVNRIQRQIDQYTALSAFRPYGITIAEGTYGTVPFKITPVGPEDKGGVLMHLSDSYINGNEADITFDTGAGANVISRELAQKFGLIALDAKTKARGEGVQHGGYAIAKELKIGNITVTDVPFYVMDFSTGNETADEYGEYFSIVVGSELMLQLKELTIDFDNSCITVPREAPQRSGAYPNMCFSQSMNLLAKSTVHGMPVLMLVDTGNASYGYLGQQFYESNKEFVISTGSLETVRTAGFGGVNASQCYRVPEMECQIGGNSIVLPSIDVHIEPAHADEKYEHLIGLKALMLFGTVHFNMADFTVTTTPAK